MRDVKITPISPSNVIGEGPHWLEQDQSLVYVDIINSDLYRYYTETQRLQKLHIDDPSGTVSFIIPFEGRPDEFAVGVGRSVSSVTWSPSDPDFATKKASPLVAIDQHCTNTRMNDGKCDPRGRLWAGTMAHEKGPGEFPPHEGTLYRFNSNFAASPMVPKVSVSNGLAWSHCNKILYYIDSLNLSVDAYDYNNDTGSIANRKVVLDFKALGIGGLPDGMAIDVDGNLWVACFNAWKMIVVDPKVGKVSRSFKLPSCNVTSCCWGGPDYSTLYVTSGTKNRSAEELTSYPDSGKTFAVTGLGTKGTPPTNYHVDLKLLDKLKAH